MSETKAQQADLLEQLATRWWSTIDATDIAALKAGAQALRETPAQWRPIETAPKDSVVDLWVVSYQLVSRDSDDMRPAVAFRVPDAVIWDGVICDEDGNPHERLEGFSEIKATHWMLPTPPADRTEEEKCRRG